MVDGGHLPIGARIFMVEANYSTIIPIIFYGDLIVVCLITSLAMPNASLSATLDYFLIMLLYLL